MMITAVRLNEHICVNTKRSRNSSRDYGFFMYKYCLFISRFLLIDGFIDCQDGFPIAVFRDSD